MERAQSGQATRSAYALVHGIRATRQTLASWRRRPGPVIGAWVAGSVTAALVLLLAVWGVAGLASPARAYVSRPPFVVGGLRDVVRILGHNLLVLALHAMACVAGFIGGSSLPLQAQARTGLARAVHEHGGRLAIAFVIGATTFSLSAQALVLGIQTASVADTLETSPGRLLLVLALHAVPELTALFLPLAAWIIASRRGQWGQLLAATLVTVAIAVPVLVATAAVEVYVSPHLTAALLPAVPPVN